jgi:hypothetical protein
VPLMEFVASELAERGRMQSGLATY